MLQGRKNAVPLEFRLREIHKMSRQTRLKTQFKARMRKVAAQSEPQRAFRRARLWVFPTR